MQGGAYPDRRLIDESCPGPALSRTALAAVLPSHVCLWITMCIEDVHRRIELWITLWTTGGLDWA